MKTEELIADAQRMVKELRGRINGGGMGLDEAEGQILEMVNWINPGYRFWHCHPRRGGRGAS